jgi:hypothetical protein
VINLAAVFRECMLEPYKTKKKKKTPWPLVRKRTIPTERPPHVDEVSANWNRMSWYKCDGSALVMTNRGRLPMLLTRKFPFIPSEVGSFPLSHPLFFYDAVDPMRDLYEPSSWSGLRQSAPLPPCVKVNSIEILIFEKMSPTICSGAFLPIFCGPYCQWFPSSHLCDQEYSGR